MEAALKKPYLRSYLAYAGTYHTLMTNCGFSEEEAKSIETNYHELYKESDKWKAGRLDQCAKDGYATVAFGLRVRTPILKQVLWGNSKTPYKAHEEARTVGNAMSQSYGLMNNRAVNAFMEKVWASPYKEEILPIAQIHDASYYLVKKDPEILEWLNIELVKEYNWNDLPEIFHKEVGLGGEVSVFYPTWAEEISIPNEASLEEIRTTLNLAFNDV